MYMFFEKYSHVEVTYLLIWFIKIKYFMGNTKIYKYTNTHTQMHTQGKIRVG